MQFGYNCGCLLRFGFYSFLICLTANCYQLLVFVFLRIGLLASCSFVSHYLVIVLQSDCCEYMYVFLMIQMKLLVLNRADLSNAIPLTWDTSESDTSV